MIHASGLELISDISNTRLESGQLAFWWLGQHSFVVKLGARVVYIDPFLTEMPERRVEPLLRAQDIINADLILGTHDHGDHIDRPAWPILATASPRASFIVPKLIQRSLECELEIGPNRLLGLDDGMSVEHRGVIVRAIAAAHEFLDRDLATGMHPYLGYIIESNGCRVYHAGDTCRYEGLVGKLQSQAIDVAFLPINGRDARRFAANIIGNMTYQEAADLAGEFRPRLVVPAHYDMFEGNLADPQDFLNYIEAKHTALSAMICEYGKGIVVNCGN